MNSQHSNGKRILVGCVAIVLILIGLLVWHALTFHVVSTEPSVGNMATISPFFKVTFSQKLSSTGLSVNGSPAGFIGTPTVSGKVLTIPLNVPLQSGRLYTIQIASISSVSGKQITNQAYNFVPTYTDSSTLPADQQRALLKLQTDSKPNTNDPIISHLPHWTTDYTLAQDVIPTKNPPKKLQLIATITLSQADMGNQAAAEAQYKQEVLNYITSLGLNPDNYTITYAVQTP